MKTVNYCVVCFVLGFMEMRLDGFGCGSEVVNMRLWVVRCTYVSFMRDLHAFGREFKFTFLFIPSSTK